MGDLVDDSHRRLGYSWGNVLLIYSQRPEATHVAGLHAWLKMGRHVRKGEKGLVILAPMVGRKKTDDSHLKYSADSPHRLNLRTLAEASRRRREGEDLGFFKRDTATSRRASGPAPYAQRHATQVAPLPPQRLAEALDC
jgi:hypothetical protein